MRPMNGRLAIILGLLLLAACAPTGPGSRAPDTGDGELARAERLAERGDFEAAALAWEQAALTRPLDADNLLVRAAEAWLRAGRLEPAALALARVDPETLDHGGRVRLDLAHAELAMERGELANAGWLLASTAGQLPESLGGRHAELESRLAELESRPIRGAVEALREAVSEPDFSGETALALLLEYPLARLEDVLYDVGDRPDLMPWLDLVISAREHLLDHDRLEQALDAWQRRWPQIDYPAREAREWIAAWRQTRPLPGQVTVLLPDRQSPLHRPGEALREGLIAAWLDLPPTRRPQVDFRYIGPEPEDALAAWFDAREQGSEFIIGPIDRGQADALATLPDAGLIPTLLLNLPDDPGVLGEASGEIAALALPPEVEAEMAAIHALASGHERALVLSQYSGWGERVADAFVETFNLGGGRILANRIYDPQLPDHSTLLREVLEVDESQRRIDRLSGLIDGEFEGVAQRRSDIDAIFLGARSEDGRVLRPQLEFFDAADITLMATSYIVEGAPEPGRDRDLDGITTPMPPWFLDFTPAGALRQRAAERFDGLDNATLSRLHALGRDAMALLPWLGMMRADPELAMPAMVGTLSLPDGGVVQRDLPVVEIRGGLARPVTLDDDPQARR